MISTDIGVWIAAFLTLCVWSYLIKDNRFFTLAEYTFVSMMTAHAIVMGIFTIRSYASVPLARGDFSVLLPIVVGPLLYATLWKKYYWISKWPTALLVGVGTGLAIRGFISAQIVGQVIGLINTANVTGDAVTVINSALIIILAMGTISYFVFTIPTKNRAVSNLNRIGRAAMMLAFGAVMGNGLLADFARLMQRMVFLLVGWLGLG